MFKTRSTSAAIFVSTLTCCLLSGCASTGYHHPEDPYEGYNRKVFAFNLGFDRHVYRPIAKGYDLITPKFVQRRISNFFSNLDQISVVGNDLLQLNGPWMASDVGRLVFNTTLGIGGLFDPATRMGMQKHNQDFGLTIARWGIKKSPYFIFPLLQPSTTRDFLGYAVDGTVFTLWTYIDPDWIGYSARALDLIESRAKLLPTDKLVDQAFDPYIFVRDFYLQNRKAKIDRVLNPEEVIEGEIPLAPMDVRGSMETEGTSLPSTENLGADNKEKPTSAQSAQGS